MTAKAGVRLEVDARKAMQAVKDFSKSASADLEKVRQKGATATAALSKGNAKLTSSTRAVRDQIKPLGEGLESMNMALGNTGNQAAMAGGALLRLAAGPMGLVTAAAGLAVVGITKLFAMQAEAHEKLREQIAKTQAAQVKYSDLVLSVQPLQIRAEAALNKLLVDREATINSLRRLSQPTTGGGFGSSGMGVPGGMRRPSRDQMAPDHFTVATLSLGELKDYAAVIVATQPELVRTKEGWDALQKSLAGFRLEGSRLGVVNDELMRLVGPTATARLDAAGSALGRLREDFDAVGDPLRQVTLKYDRLFDTIRDGLPITRLLTEAQKEQLAGLRELIDGMKFDETARSEMEWFRTYWADIARFATEASDNADALQAAREAFVAAYAAKNQGLIDYGALPMDLTTAPDGLKPDVEKDYSQIRDDFSGDMAGNIKSSVSDALYDGFRTGFANTDQILDSFFASFQRGITDALAAGMMQAAGIDAGSIAEGITGLFGGASGENSAGAVT